MREAANRDPGTLINVLRSVVEELETIPRLPTSDGERQAATLIRQRLSRSLLLSGRRPAVIEPVQGYRSYAWPIGLLCAASAASALATRRRHRALGAIGGLLATAGIIDDITGGPMLTRRLFMRKRATQNVIAEAGDPNAALTLVVLAHHDAAPSGVIFANDVETWLADHHPEVIRRMTSNPPLWWLVIAGPALVALGSLSRRSRPGDRMVRLGAALSLTALAAMLDIGHRRAVPGANDNLSGVAAMIAAADVLSAEPPEGLRMIFASMGAEEALQQGVRGFAATHFPELPVANTYFVVLDTLGFGRLVMLEAEGPVRLHDYDPAFKDLVAACAEDAGVDLVRGLRSRNSTDGSVPRRHGYPTVSIVSVNERKLMPHYHLYSDTSANLNYESVRQATELVIAVAHQLAHHSTHR